MSRITLKVVSSLISFPFRVAHFQKCNICRQGFASRTKLFDHIKATGHASLKTVGFAGKSAPPGGKSGDWSSEDEGRGKKGKKKGKR